MYVTEANEKGVDNVSDKLQSVGISGADGAAPSSSQTGMLHIHGCVCVCLMRYTYLLLSISIYVMLEAFCKFFFLLGESVKT